MKTKFCTGCQSTAQPETEDPGTNLERTKRNEKPTSKGHSRKRPQQPKQRLNITLKSIQKDPVLGPVMGKDGLDYARTWLRYTAVDETEEQSQDIPNDFFDLD